MAKITKSIRTSEVTCAVYDSETQEIGSITVPVIGNVTDKVKTLKRIRREQDTERVTVLAITHIETNVKTYRVDLDKFLGIAEEVIRKPRQTKNTETPDASPDTASPAKKAKR